MQLRHLESAALRRWICQGGNSVRAVRFVWRKLREGRRWRRLPYGYPYYPAVLQALVDRAAEPPSADAWALPGESVGAAVGAAGEGAPESIELASGPLPLHGEAIPWQRAVADPEDEEALHRWRWLLTTTDGDPSPARLAWCVAQLEQWIARFGHEVSARQHRRGAPPARWQSYTVGERIANSIAFFARHQLRPSIPIREALVGFAQFLVRRVEYRGRYTGNHIINNARALYLAGVAFQHRSWRDIATAILREALERLVTPDGFLREGSSHYQLLFTRWIDEILQYAQRQHDTTLTEFLQPVLERLQQRCHFFLIPNAARASDLVLFGDISPDCSPAWLLERVRPTLPPPGPTVPIEAYPQSGWYRGKVAEQTLLLRAEAQYRPEHVGHHHNDLYHFCLYRAGHPILTDPGRKSYRLDDAWGAFGLSAAAHNAVLVDGVGALPERWHRYPLSYTAVQAECAMQSQPDAIDVVIGSDGFRRLGHGLRGTRRLHLKRDRLLITDEFAGAGTHTIDLFFHWAPAVGLTPQGDGAWLVRVEGMTGRFRVPAGLAGTTTVHRGGDDPLGWSCPQYGQAVPSWTLQHTVRVPLPCRLQCELEWSA